MLERQKLELEKVNQMSLLEKQAALNAVERESGYNLKVQILETESDRIWIQFENEPFQKQKRI